MNKLLTIFVFSIITNSMFSQKSETIITGTVYMSASISNGAMGYPSSSEGPYLFRKQNIYFKKDSITVNTKTDSAGVFSIELKAGQYVVYQEGGLNNDIKGLNNFGTDVIDVKKGGGPYKIMFRNSSNRRSTMNSGLSGKGLPGSKPTKTTQKTSEK